MKSACDAILEEIDKIIRLNPSDQIMQEVWRIKEEFTGSKKNSQEEFTGSGLALSRIHRVRSSFVAIINYTYILL